jgi:drug/metabolite transporter (DMT)-like permease
MQVRHHLQNEDRFRIMSANSTAAGALVRYGLLITAIGGLLFTFDLPLLRLAAADKWTMIFARGVMMFMSISIMWYFARGWSDSNAPYIAGGAGLAVIATNTVGNITYIGSIVETDAANVVFILALTPVLTGLFSHLFLRERIHRFTWLAAALSFLGVAIIVWDGLHSGELFGNLLAFACACCTATAFTIVRSSGKNVATSLAIGSLISAAVALLFFPIDFASLLAPSGFGVPALAWIALNGLVTIPIASTLIANGPRYLPSVDVSMFFMLETVLTPLWIWMIFGETPSPWVLWGGVIIIATLVTHSLWRLREAFRHNAPIYGD